MNRLLSLAVVSLALTGCEAESFRVCTLIGCNDGLTVQVTNAPAGPYRIEAYVSSGLPRYGQDCPGGPCIVFFPDFTPADVFIQVITPPDTSTHHVQPMYTLTRPNGPGCDPECRQATVNIAL